MDGLFHGSKPYFLMDDLGGCSPYFWKHPIPGGDFLGGVQSHLCLSHLPKLLAFLAPFGVSRSAGVPRPMIQRGKSWGVKKKKLGCLNFKGGNEYHPQKINMSPEKGPC